MLQNISNFFNILKGKKVKKNLAPSDLIAIGVRNTINQSDYQPSAIFFKDLEAQLQSQLAPGPQGPIGPQGVPGPVGPAGLNWQGAWSPTGVYAIDDAVGYGGASWFCIDPVGPSATNPASDPTNWALLASQGATGPMGPQGIQGPAGPAGLAEVTYSNVIFIDAVNGNDATGLFNRFDKPYATLNNLNIIVPPLSPQPSNRVLVYVRRGSYSTGIQLLNNVDFYCEPGVVFVGGTAEINDYGAAVNSNVFGSLRMNSTKGITISGASYCTIEFDELVTYYPAISLLCTGVSNRITINGNYISSSGFSGGCGVTIRNATNAVMNIKNSINCQHHVVLFRFFTGTATVNCPNINLTAGNIYGGNFKSAVGVYDAQTTGKITVNANLNCTDPVNYGGVGSTLLFFSNAVAKFRLNGNISGGVLKAIDGNTFASGVIEINGNMSSSNLYTAFAYGAGQIIYRNSVIINTGAVANSYALAVNGTAKIFLKDCYLYNNLTDSNLIQINGASTNLVLDCCQGNTPGTLGGSTIVSTAGAITARIHNSRFSKALGPGVTDLYSPTGMIVDTNTIVPTVIN